MKILYFDCFSGASGDMLLGALAALGADLAIVEKELNTILPQQIKLSTSSVVVQGIEATDVKVKNTSSATFTGLAEVKEILLRSSLPTNERTAALEVFTRLASCEARIHGVPIDKVHFHELGAIDTLADVIGFLLALRQLGVKKLFCSPLPMARGLLQMAHGQYPLPAPATLELLKGTPCYGVEANLELVTPTGAAILTTLCQDFGPFPSMTISEVGYGAGKNQRVDVPNLLRVISGQATTSLTKEETVGIIETNLDDMNPEYFSFLFEKFFQLEGALDLSVQPIVMKKNRPGFHVQCLVKPDFIPLFANLLFEETSTLGVRYRLEKRLVLPWRSEEIVTRWGRALVKVCEYNDGSIRIAPEYESCRAIAFRTGIPIRQVVDEIMEKARKR